MKLSGTSMQQRLARTFEWRRLRITLIASLAWGLLLSLIFESPTWSLLARTLAIGLVALSVFGFLEQWPRRLPAFLARWVLQVLGVAISVPFTVSVYYLATSETGVLPFWEGGGRLTGFMILTVTGMLFAPWFAMSALLRQRDESVRSQAQAFERERGKLERAAIDARLRFLQAQVQPHFLFNTLANVRELVESGSTQAPIVLDHLITYLRAAVPRLDEAAIPLGQELELVRAYLELMQMRMPDRLKFSINTEANDDSVCCPPMTILTLVENAVRHGIDPSVEGGSIDVDVQVCEHENEQQCQITVSDSGIGLGTAVGGLGTGLATLRERLQLAYGTKATLQLRERKPHGLIAELVFPARSRLS
jgi:LytS/YehU family sensor histidine kinase